jgi:hypothetical protein
VGLDCQRDAEIMCRNCSALHRHSRVGVTIDFPAKDIALNKATVGAFDIRSNIKELFVYMKKNQFCEGVSEPRKGMIATLDY